MKGIELLALGLRLVGIYGLLRGIQFISIAIGTIRQYSVMMPGEDLLLWYVIFGVSLVVYFLAVLALIVFPASIAAKLIPKGDEQAPLVQVSAAELQVIAFTVLGVYILSWSLPDLVYNVASLWNTVRMGDVYAPHIFSEHVINTCVTTLEVGIGLYLTFQAEGLTRLIRMIRGLGYKYLKAKPGEE